MLIAAGLCICTLGCSPGATRFVHPEADLPYYQTIAVMPFEALSNDRLAGEKVTSVFFSEVLRMGFDQVVEPGQLTTAMSRVRRRYPAEQPVVHGGPGQAGGGDRRAGVLHGNGSRLRHGCRRARPLYPLLSLEARFVDAVTGRVVWSASTTRRGGPPTALLGWMATRTMGELTTDMCRELLGTLPKGGTSSKAAPAEKSTPKAKAGKVATQDLSEQAPRGGEAAAAGVAGRSSACLAVRPGAAQRGSRPELRAGGARLRLAGGAPVLRVAVLPLANYTPTRDGPDRVAPMLVAELLPKPGVVVAEAGAVQASPRQGALAAHGPGAARPGGAARQRIARRGAWSSARS